MNETIKLILSLSLSGSILAIIIFAMKPLIKNRFSKSIQYYIWIVVLLRLILPFSFEGSIMNNVFYGEQTSRAISSQSLVLPTDGTNGSISNSSRLTNVQENLANGVYNGDTDHGRFYQDLFNQYALYLWLFGVIIALAANLTGYARFSKYLKRANKPATDEQNRILTALLNRRYNVRLIRNRFVTTPLLIGILRPCIIIPDIHFNEKQLKYVLLHEISHLKRFDIRVKWLTMIATSIHWFNPLMYFIKKEINYSCELACDEAVIKNLNPAEKQDYGDTLISVVSEHKYPAGVLQATMSEEKETLKERLVAIMKYNKKSKSIILLSIVLLAAVVIGAVLLGACSGKTNRAVTYKNNADYEVVNFADGQVEIAGRKLAYKATDLAPLYKKISQVQVEQMMYRAVAFYEAAFARDYDTVNRLANQQLNDELKRWADNSSKKEDYSAMPIMKLDNYIDLAFPIGISAPKPNPVESDRYMVMLEISKDTQVQIYFAISTDGNPLVAGFSILVEGKVQN